MRERIFENARQLFLEHGFAATTVEQIAEAADIAQTTFFNHFQSKGAVLRDMTREVSEHLEMMLERELATPGSAIERITRFTLGVVSEIDQSQDLARDVLLELMRTTTHPGDALPYFSSVYEPFTSILSDGQSEGNVRMDVESRVLAELVIGSLNMALIGWLNDPDYPFEKRLSQFATLIGDVIVPR